MFLLHGVLITLVAVMYVADNERLSYVDLSGPAKTASRPILSGLSTPGPWIGEMEEFLDYAQGEIPAEDPTLVFPGEDPFYYALQRRPLFPVLTFDETVNPYSDRQHCNWQRSGG